ncbi:hypothetical protein, partial [Psychrobacillus vulpis]|uniref:hypothetical protein n=1 Tax=Psychrobacillus vulpis TaxID=2325572 RepID=UPI0019809CA3
EGRKVKKTGEKGNFSFKIERKIVFFDGEYIKKLKAKVFQCPPEREPFQRFSYLLRLLDNPI